MGNLTLVRFYRILNDFAGLLQQVEHLIAGLHAVVKLSDAGGDRQLYGGCLGDGGVLRADSRSNGRTVDAP